MIVELIGASGVGKTTLARALASRSPTDAPARMATDLVTDRPGRRWIGDPHAINLLADVTALPWFARSLGRQRDFVRFAFARLGRHAPSTFARLNYMRNVVRKVGLHELARRADGGTTLLFDEGTILTAYQLFVYSDAPYTRSELERFARLVPLPDRIVHVKAPIDVLLRRAMTRDDRRRELARTDADQVERWIVRAVELFDALAEIDPLRDRLVTVDIGDDEPERLDTAVREVSASFDRLGPSLRPTARRRLPGKATVIAFVGSEATGKSTILSEVEGWLVGSHRVRRVHAGKPPSTAITFVPHVLLPALRAIFPEQRTLRVEERYEDGAKEGDGEDDGASKTIYPLLFGVRSVMLAYERRALLVRAARSGRGTVVLCDRYPSNTSGAPDGPQLAHLPMPSGRFSVRRALAKMEDRLYRDIPAPDLVFHLSAPLDVTLARNAARGKREPEPYVRFRHELSSRLRFDGAPVHHVDTDRDLELVVQEIEGVIGDGRATAR